MRVLFWGCLAAFSFAASAKEVHPSDVEREKLATDISSQVRMRTDRLLARRAAARGCVPDEAKAPFRNWQEKWPDGKGGCAIRTVGGRVWNDAIASVLAEKGMVFLPARPEPYYLDGPIVIASGQSLIADRWAEFRLLPSSNTCIVRNKSVVGMDRRTYAVPDVPYDEDVFVEGGIWTTLQTMQGEHNGNEWGRPSKTGGAAGCYGALLFNHVKNLIVKDVTVRRCHMHGIQLSDVHGFRVDGVTFEEHGRDGVHMHGRCDWGVVRNVSGDSYDDMVALNAWDWFHTAPVLGPVHHILVEDIVCNNYAAGLGSNGSRSIRLLPGNSVLKDGTGRRLSCPVEDVVVRRVSGLGRVVALDQPNGELGRDVDFSDPIGTLRNVYFSDLYLTTPCRFSLDLMIDGFDVSRVTFAVPPQEPLLVIEPFSQTMKIGSDPARWIELFSPDKDIAVNNVTLREVFCREDGTIRELGTNGLVRIRNASLNPDYPRTVPRGGVGKVTIGRALPSKLKDVRLKARTDKENPIGYRVGEPIRFDFRLDGVKTLPPEMKQPLSVIWNRTGDDGVSVCGTNAISLAKGFSFTTALKAPGIVRCVAQLVDADYKWFEEVAVNPWDKGIRVDAGAGAETEKMRLTTVEPADFDAFWKRTKAALATVPVKARLKDVTPIELKGTYRTYAAEVDCFGPRPVTGWLTIPEKASPKSLKARAVFDGYNGSCFPFPTVPKTFEPQTILFRVNAHGYELVGHDPKYYEAFGREVNGVGPGKPPRKTYALEPSDYDHPDETYFRFMAMRVMRAFDYLKSRPEWNGRDLEAQGESQGGLQTMWAAGLVDGLTRAFPSVTWGCDIGNSLSPEGSRFLSNEWGLPHVSGAFYFDSVLHAKRVPVSCRVEITRLGLGDYTCPPRGVLLSYYALRGPASVRMIQGSTHCYVPDQPNQTFEVNNGR